MMELPTNLNRRSIFFDYIFAAIEILRGISDGLSKEDIFSKSEKVTSFFTLLSEQPGNTQWFYRNLLDRLYETHKDSDANACKDAMLKLIDTEYLGLDGESSTPVQNNFGRLIGSLAEYYQCKNVFNPFAGRATFAQYLPQTVSYHGVEIDPKICALAKMRFTLLNRKNCTIECADIRSNYPDCDMIVTDVPDIKLRNHTHLGEIVLDEVSKYICKTSIGIYPYHILNSRRISSKDTRERLIQQDFIESVIKLPSSLYDMFGGTSLCMIITNRHKSRQGYIRFIDASSFAFREKGFTHLDVDRLNNILQNPDQDFAECVWASSSDVLYMDCNLAVELYTIRKMQVPEGYKLVSLKDILTQIGENVGSLEDPAPLIQVKDLAINPFDFTLGEELPLSQSSKTPCKYIDEPALLISRIHALKPTYFTAKCGGVYINQNVVAFKIASHIVSSQYLLSELSKEYVQNQLVYSGSTITSLSINDFRLVKILVPTMQEQQDYSIIKDVLTENKRKDDIFASALETYTKEMGQRQHTLGHVVGNLDDILDRLSTIMQKNNGVLRLSDIVRPGETVEDYINKKLQFTFKRLQSLVNDLDNGIEWREPTKIDIVDFVEKFKVNYPHHGYSVHIGNTSIADDNSEDNKYFISFPSAALNDVFENIFNNIRKHGFVDASRLDYQVKILLEMEKLNGKPAIALSFMNNGKVLDDSMTKEKVFKWGESTNGTGRGGAHIKLLVTTYGGEVDFLLSDDLPEQYNTGYRVVLPLV